jgi:hypothetical protein
MLRKDGGGREGQGAHPEAKKARSYAVVCLRYARAGIMRLHGDGANN